MSMMTLNMMLRTRRWWNISIMISMIILIMMVSRGRFILTIRHREMSIMMINVTDVGIVMITIMITVSIMVITVMTGIKTMFGWRRTDQSSRFPNVVFFLGLVFQHIRRKRSSIADSITVSEMSMVPFLLPRYVLMSI